MAKEKCKICGLVNDHNGVFLPCACSDSWELGAGDKRVIRHHIGYLHVSTSNMSIARDILRRAHNSGMKSKRARFAAARYAIECHEQNKALYAIVMGGAGCKVPVKTFSQYVKKGKNNADSKK